MGCRGLVAKGLYRASTSRQRAGFLDPQRYHGSPKRGLAKLLAFVEGLHELQPIFRTKFSGHGFLAPN